MKPRLQHLISDVAVASTAVLYWSPDLSTPTATVATPSIAGHRRIGIPYPHTSARRKRGQRVRVTSEGTDAVTSVRTVGPAATEGRTAHVSRVARPRRAHGAAPFPPSMPPRDHGTRRPHPTPRPHPLRRLLLCPSVWLLGLCCQHTTTQVFSFRTKNRQTKNTRCMQWYNTFVILAGGKTVRTSNPFCPR
jgi:hypothetical protein